MSKSRFPWRVPATVMNTAVAVWFVVVIAGNVPAVASRVQALLVNPTIANVVGALLGAILLLSSLVIWSGALNHFQYNNSLAGWRRSVWAAAVWGLFVFGGLAYYFSHMWRVRAPAA